jgi:hypothetical protein
MFCSYFRLEIPPLRREPEWPFNHSSLSEILFEEDDLWKMSVLLFEGAWEEFESNQMCQNHSWPLPASPFLGRKHAG